MPRTTKRAVKSKKPESEVLNKAIDEYWDKVARDEVGVDNATGVDVPLHLRGGSFKWNFQKRMPWYDKVTWVLTGVNVAIFITLVINNL